MPYAFFELFADGTERDITDELPFEIPESWVWVRLGTIGTFIRGSGIKRSETQSTGVRCIRYGELYTKYNIKMTQAVSYVSEDLAERSKSLFYGDLLFTLTGENKEEIGKTVAFLSYEQTVIGGDLATFTGHQQNPMYLSYIMNSPYAIMQKALLGTGDIIVRISYSNLSSILIPLLSGLRRGELLSLRWNDIDFENKTVRVFQASQYVQGHGLLVDTPKNESSSRTLKLPTSIFVLLGEYKQWQDAQREVCGDYWKDRDNRVFTGDDVAPVNPDGLTKWFHKFARRCGLSNMTLHSLHHSYASLLIADGVPLVVVSKRLGHKQVSTTSNIYSHIIQSADEKAAHVSSKFDDVVVPKGDCVVKSSPSEPCPQ